MRIALVLAALLGPAHAAALCNYFHSPEPDAPETDLVAVIGCEGVSVDVSIVPPEGARIVPLGGGLVAVFRVPDQDRALVLLRVEVSDAEGNRDETVLALGVARRGGSRSRRSCSRPRGSVNRTRRGWRASVSRRGSR